MLLWNVAQSTSHIDVGESWNGSKEICMKSPYKTKLEKL